MTREEQILNKAIDYSEIEENFLEYDDCGDVCDDKTFIEKAFIEGAKWADRTTELRVRDYLESLTYQEFPGGPMERLISDDVINRLIKTMKE